MMAAQLLLYFSLERGEDIQRVLSWALDFAISCLL